MRDDELLARSVANMAAMWSTTARSCGGRVEQWPGALATDARAPNVVLNRTTVTDPSAGTGELTERLSAFYGSRDLPWGVVDPWDSLDLREHGFAELVRMPCMVLESAEPFRSPAGLRIEQVTTMDGLRDFKRALFGGFSLVEWPSDPDPQFGSAFYEDPMRRVWVGYAGDVPAACSVSVVCEGVAGVYLVAVRPEFRNRGFGEAATWAASLPGEGLPALLQASSMGLSIYRRMGYRTIGEAPFWVPRAAATP